ncbi:MAG: MoaD/ThiS family protein [Kiritimatiellae bacterium]|nr:MoaD/ThiS family protein [Kiritimatiellia bacterium]
MKIKYQGNDKETAAATVAGFLDENGISAKTAIVEYGGEVYAADFDFSTIALSEGAELNVFNIVSGG